MNSSLTEAMGRSQRTKRWRPRKKRNKETVFSSLADAPVCVFASKAVHAMKTMVWYMNTNKMAGKASKQSRKTVRPVHPKPNAEVDEMIVSATLLARPTELRVVKHASSIFQSDDVRTKAPRAM